MMPAFCGEGVFYWEMQCAQEEVERKIVAAMVEHIRKKEYDQLEKYIHEPLIQKNADVTTRLRKTLFSLFPEAIKEKSRDMRKRESFARVLIQSIEEENYRGLLSLIGERKKLFDITDRYYQMLSFLERALNDHLIKPQELTVI